MSQGNINLNVREAHEDSSDSNKSPRLCIYTHGNWKKVYTLYLFPNPESPLRLHTIGSLRPKSWDLHNVLLYYDY